MSSHTPQTDTALLDEAIESLKAIRNKCLSRPSVLDDPISYLENKRQATADATYAERRESATARA